MRKFAITYQATYKGDGAVDFVEFGEDGEEMELWVYLEAYVEVERYPLSDIMSVIEITHRGEPLDDTPAYRQLDLDPDADNSPPFYVNVPKPPKRFVQPTSFEHPSDLP